MAEVKKNTNKAGPAAKKPAAKKPAAKKPVAKKPASKTPVAKTPVGKKPVAKKTAPRKTAATKNKTAVAKTTTAKVRSSMKDDINNLKTDASDTVRQTANKGKAKASEAIGGISERIRETAASIDEAVGEKYGGFARNAADTMDDFAKNLNNKDVDDFVDDARNFVRKSPALAIGAAAAIGFLITRIIRAGNDKD